jgi:hypothetical protein
MTPQSNWRDIAEKTSKEMDPTKLAVLVADLCRAIEGERQENPHQHASKEPETI